ncbi:MAG: hypothetical protein HY616_02680 [Candidatus Rokubacteria bacterium]|nr:hypothetical protein [Candidatus Rokubacteria bacterium]MBI2157470.1 hypothetical protein [Candidatus Rokubacteria bacterium]MBI4253954.1 hypothetical protein [Candidatus Rokubacteria bacterium]
MPLLRISLALARWLFSHQLEKSHPAHVVAWWELRRLPYNVIVGATAALSLGVFFAVGFTCERAAGVPLGFPTPPLLVAIAVLAYGVVVNVFYTGGWILELLVARLWRVSTPAFGPIAFTLWTTLSVVVTLIPAGLVILLAAVTSCRGL